jgi:hypothetical protein
MLLLRKWPWLSVGDKLNKFRLNLFYDIKLMWFVMGSRRVYLGSRLEK